MPRSPRLANGFSPDGTKIIYAQEEPDHSPQVYVTSDETDAT